MPYLSFLLAYPKNFSSYPSFSTFLLLLLFLCPFLLLFLSAASCLSHTSAPSWHFLPPFFSLITFFSPLPFFEYKCIPSLVIYFLVHYPLHFTSSLLFFFVPYLFFVSSPPLFLSLAPSTLHLFFSPFSTSISSCLLPFCFIFIMNTNIYDLNHSPLTFASSSMTFAPDCL